MKNRTANNEFRYG